MAAGSSLLNIETAGAEGNASISASVGMSCRRRFPLDELPTNKLAKESLWNISENKSWHEFPMDA